MSAVRLANEKLKPQQEQEPEHQLVKRAQEELEASQWICMNQIEMERWVISTALKHSDLLDVCHMTVLFWVCAFDWSVILVHFARFNITM